MTPTPNMHRTLMNEGSTGNDQLRMLLESISHGDQAAFKNLYASTSAQLFATLLSMLRIEAVAEEALQETYMKIWHSAGSYRHELGQPLTWMTGIARYHALDVLRKSRSQDSKESSLDGLPNADATGAHPTLNHPREKHDVLEKCFVHLSSEQRICITRAYLEGLTTIELSESTHSPEVTVKNWVRRGLISLKDCINELS